MGKLDDRILQARELIEQEDIDGAAQLLLEGLTQNKPKVRDGEGEAYFYKIIPYLLSQALYEEVAHLLWGKTLFNAEPLSVQIIWEEIQNSNTLLITGAGSVGKSYSLAAWLLLDWLEDPEFTCIKVVSATEEHAKRNVFAHMKNLHRSSSIKLPGLHKENSIQASEDATQGIHLVAIPKGDEGSGRLQGFHPKPRKTLHPKYGALTRVRAILDEAEEIPGGVWPDIDNMLITIDDSDHVKIGGAANPRNRDSAFGKRCEPADGWSSVDIEHSQAWNSKLGWRVVRLDGARCENVVQKKTVFPGFLTYEGYRRYLLQGDTSPEYLTMARGWFPEQGLAINVIPRDFMDRAFGQLHFTGKVTYCAAIDLAFEGGDKAIMTIGRFGLCLGYTARDAYTKFDQPKYCLQAEAQFELTKNDPDGKLTQTLWLESQIRRHCKNLNFKAYWVICDRTGNGTGVHDLLKQVPSKANPDGPGIGPEVTGIHFGAGATEMKLFEDSTKKACDEYDGIVTELFFATRNYLEFDFLKLSPSLNTGRLSEELCTRRYKPGKKTRVEGKREFCSRDHPSPDFADSLTLMVHLVRLRRGLEASMLADSGTREKGIEPGIVDKLEYLQWN